MVVHGLLLCKLKKSTELFGWGSDVGGLVSEW
jgi:hypothetical protein